ncbi:hypothetical protein SAMN03159343_1662 [Klenkia marina]|uniref:Excreted virulence factor EspC, type VII ESX diderm n=1 Tax=Klenkia marina TaxID=1960309 RepID=A0A1G4XYP3_9ACTN|nr:hypothetical protein [Klenkia marina]SCX45758.1 hypothetical protein SAMN03159343_1662 [Klenkia marina]
MAETNSGNSVSIDPAQAGAGILAWEAAEGALNQSVTNRLATIQSLQGGQPWGSDEAGQNFASGDAGYVHNAGAVGDGVRAVAQQLHERGQGARTAIGNSLASDADQAAEVLPVDAQVSGAGTPGSGS